MKNAICMPFRALIPGYMDGELSEEQAAPLRQHLLSCQACRSMAQEETSLSHWFPAAPSEQIPPGFAARVARAAFSGAPEQAEPQSSPPIPVEPLRSEESSLLPFILTLTSIAAGVLLCLALFMAKSEEPKGPALSAEPLPSILEELDRLNGTRPAPTLPSSTAPRR